MNIEAGDVRAGEPITRELVYWHLPINHPAIPNDIRQTRILNDASGQGDRTDTSPNQHGDWATGMLALFDKFGANSTAELPPEVRQQIPNGGIKQAGDGFWRLLGDFVTSPPFLMMVGGAFAMGAFGGAAAGAGAAGSGTSAAGLTAAEEAAMLTGSGGAGGGGLGAGTAAAGGAAAALPGEAGYLADAPLTATTGATNTLPATQAATTAAGGSALSRILEGNGTVDDYASLLGTGVDMYGAYQQRNDSKELADRYFNMGAPYRDELTRISKDPQAFYDSPQAKQATESVLRRLSATHGNVAGSPYGQALTIDALWDQYGSERDRLAGFGGLTQYNSAAPGAGANAVGAQANFYNTIGGGIADMTTPRKQLTLQDILRGTQV